MGSGRDKRKKAKGSTPGMGAEKTQSKTLKNQHKAQRRAAEAAQGGEGDLDALLKQFALEDAASATAIIKEDVPPPSARTYASFTANPLAKQGEVLLFGGEWEDNKTDRMHTFADLYRYSTSKDKWTQLIVPRGPPLRTSHQAAIVKRCLYVFGGELTSMNQKTFRHYRDLWRLDLDALSWEQLPGKGGPSARSGHRMVAYRDMLVLFGGFHDDGRGVPEYFSDVWTYDTQALKWVCRHTGASSAPTPRGGGQVAVHGDVLYAFGGHSVWVEDKREREKLHDEVWALDLLKWQWERVKKAGMAPGQRASFGMATHKGRALLFGGITDQHGAGDANYSTLHDDLYAFNMDSRRWYPLAPLRARKAAAQSAAAAAATAPADAAAPAGADASPAAREAQGVLRPDVTRQLAASGLDEGSAAHRAAVRIQSRFRGFVVRKAYKTYQLGGRVSELLFSPALYGIDLSAQEAPKPRARSSAMITVVNNTLWLFGGVVEIETADIPLDDMWCLDLAKQDGWRCVKENTAGADDFEEPSGEDDGSDAGDSD